jgi:hypothetical protein
MFTHYMIENLLYYYKNYILQCKRENHPLYIKPQSFYYLQPLFIYFYSLSFTNQSLLFTYLFLELFYSLGKSGDLVNKNHLITYSNDISSYKIMKFFNHSAFHLIFYLKLFYYKTDYPGSKYILFFFLNFFQCGIYFHKSYKRRYDFIQQLKNKDLSKELMTSQRAINPHEVPELTYPSYYKIPIITSNEKNIESIVKYTSFLNSENYYSYILFISHFFIYFFL